MVQQPLFYSSVVALSRELHARKRVAVCPEMFGFAAGQHLIPAVIDEFAAACRHLPILFLQSGGLPAPVFLVGTRPGQNDCVDQDGHWTGAYIPAFVRRYPFILGEIEGADPVICVDERSQLLSETGGEALFDGQAETPFLRERMALVSGYFDSAKRTNAAAKLLQELDLFTSVTLDFEQDQPYRSSIHGLMAINEAKIGNMTGDQTLRLHAEGLLTPIYAHLLSLGAVEMLRQKTQNNSASGYS